ncbi:MAG: NADH-quinone oxidoreductase subunit N [Legionellales bacterium RIFCSPHIGHO2_12_FULL_37_14]|nr:MAG: NADH-quinone oxidoreductase subunit N [Legionellales bacterium RIFCSPHIGHO2_12_FULL_37_14]
MNLLQNLYLALPQIIILITACLVLIFSLFRQLGTSNISYATALLGLFLAFWVSVFYIDAKDEIILSGEFISDSLGAVMNAGISASVFIVLMYSYNYILERQMPLTDILALVLFSTLGMMVLVNAHSILTSYLGLELLSLPLYALTAVRRIEGDCSEAAMKYFVMGALASGMLLFGFSLLYGATGQLDFTAISEVIAKSANLDNSLITFALVFIVAALGFKLALVPFHMWAPDVYQGAPLSVTLLLSSAPKIAGLVFMLRLLTSVLSLYSAKWQLILLVMTVISIGLGNLLAIVQTNIRRLLAYSAISHMGFAVFGVLVANQAGYSASVYYMLVYVLMTLAAFGLLVLLSRNGVEIEEIDDLKGLAQRNPWAALMLMIVLFSLAGVPPTAGFFAKLAVLKVLIDANYITTAILAVLFAVIGAYYYIRIVKVMYFDDPNEKSALSFGNGVVKFIYSAHCLSLLYFGLFPAGLISLCTNIWMS